MARSSVLAVLAMAELIPSWTRCWSCCAAPGAVLFVPLYALWVTLLLPGVWASMLAGVLYGTWGGSALVFVGACLGALAAFLLGRHWLRDWASQRLARWPRLQAIETAVSREGLRLVLLTRLSPAFPFSLLNLAYGLSAVSLRDYSLGLIGILPGTVLFALLVRWLGMWPALARCSPARPMASPGRCGSWVCCHLRCGLAGGACGPAGFAEREPRKRWLGLERQITQGRDQHKPSQPQLGRQAWPLG